MTLWFGAKSLTITNNPLAGVKGNHPFGLKKINLMILFCKEADVNLYRIHGTIVYLPTFISDLYDKCRSIYNRPMDPMFFVHMSHDSSNGLVDMFIDKKTTQVSAEAWP